MSRFLSLVPLLVLLGATAARAEVIVVDTTEDGVTGPLCDLRDAITAANDDQPVGGCTEVDPSGADVIDLTGLSGTIELESGVLPSFHSEITLLGPGADILALDGLDANQMIQVTGGTSTITGLTIANGSTEGRGGCIAVDDAFLVLRDSRVTGCEGFNGGGIAIDSGSTAHLDRVLVDANAAGNSGAGLINSESLVFIANTTFSGNVAQQAGGGVGTFGNDGGGTTTATRIHSSTFTDNGATSGADVYNSADPDPLVDTFVTHVLFQNQRGEATHCAGLEGVTSQGFNIASDATCGLDETGDVISSDVDLGPLQDNGGPTFTHALVSEGNPAIDGGNPAGCADGDGAPIPFDQRGFPRRTDGNGDSSFECDIGAFETVPEPLAGAAGAAAACALAALGQSRRRGSAHACAAAPRSSVATNA